MSSDSTGARLPAAFVEPGRADSGMVLPEESDKAFFETSKASCK